MEEYISQITVLKDALAATGEHLKETYIILIALGGPSMEYESFVTTITTRFDHSMSFSTLCELLLDQDEDP